MTTERKAQVFRRVTTWRDDLSYKVRTELKAAGVEENPQGPRRTREGALGYKNKNVGENRPQEAVSLETKRTHPKKRPFTSSGQGRGATEKATDEKRRRRNEWMLRRLMVSAYRQRWSGVTNYSPLRLRPGRTGVPSGLTASSAAGLKAEQPQNSRWALPDRFPQSWCRCAA